VIPFVQKEKGKERKDWTQETQWSDPNALGQTRQKGGGGVADNLERFVNRLYLLRKERRGKKGGGEGKKKRKKLTASI